MDNKQRSKTYYRHQKLKQNKERVADWIIAKYENVPCMDCGVVFPWVAMDFDHRPGEVKEHKISSMAWQKATENIIRIIEHEISKCDLVCANCHRVRTYITRKKDE